MLSPHHNQQQLGLACARRRASVRTSTSIAQTDVGSGETRRTGLPEEIRERVALDKNLGRTNRYSEASRHPFPLPTPCPDFSDSAGASVYSAAMLGSHPYRRAAPGRRTPARCAGHPRPPNLLSPRPKNVRVTQDAWQPEYVESCGTRDICSPGKPSTTTTTTPRRKRKRERKAGPNDGLPSGAAWPHGSHGPALSWAAAARSL